MKLEDIKVGDVFELTLIEGSQTGWNFRLTLPEDSTDDTLYYTNPYIFQLKADSKSEYIFDDEVTDAEYIPPFQYIDITKDFVPGFPNNQIVVKKINPPKKEYRKKSGSDTWYHYYQRGGGQGGQAWLKGHYDFYWVSQNPIYKISKVIKMELINWPNENPLEVKE